MTERLIIAAGVPFARIVEGQSPIVTVALHAGHAVRPSLETRLGVDDSERRREEDPHTADMAPEGITLIEVLRSRFEVDLNRPRFRAVYQGPQDAWGLNVWRSELPDAEDRVSRAAYDTFYAGAFDELSRIAERHGRFLVLDLHSYNHRRDGSVAAQADPAENPEVNLGTAKLDRDRWAPVIETFSAGMRGAGFDCRENVKFGGGHFAHWIVDTFPEQGCVLAIEFKKTYMDEWTGEVDRVHVGHIRESLSALVAPLAVALDKVV